tara:strand:+ start:20057 stop:20980 length:924 start_codon:yes stop_codon:yes gene_type:complete
MQPLAQQARTIPLSNLPGGPLGDLPDAHVALLRLDLGGGLAPGNKAFKFAEILDTAQRTGVTRLVSFGGPWSNHLHAVAAVAKLAGMDSVGLVRGADGPHLSAMLQDAQGWGMQIVPLTRARYRRRNEPQFLAAIQREYSPCLVIPEGGASAAGVRGCMAIASHVKSAMPDGGRVVVPVGTGTTLAGVVAGLDNRYEVAGVTALKGAADLSSRVHTALEPFAGGNLARWYLLDDFDCGGFARVTPELRQFLQRFEQRHALLLEPVYTAKMLFAVYQLLHSGEWSPSEPVLALHTGGLQGRRGFDWLD